MGYEAMREQTLARQKELGIVPADTELPPINPIGTPETRTGPDGQPFPALDYTRPWDSLNDDEKRLFARMAEVYAGFLAHADHHIGRLLDYLEQTEQLENTIDRRRLRQRRERRGRPERLGQRDEVRQRRRRRPRREPREARRPRRHEDVQPLPERLGDGVQHAVQDVEALRVQRRHRATRASSPGRPGPRRAARSATSTTTRSTSSRRSSTSSASRPPRRSRATPRAPFDGVSMRDSIDDASADVGAEDAVLRDARLPLDLARGLEGGHDPPDASPAGATSTTTSGSSTTPTSTGPSCNNLAAEQPDKLRELVNIWFSEAGANGAFPLDDRSAVEILTTPRPQLTAPRNRYVYYPDTAPVSEWQAVNTRNRSFVIGALVDIPAPGSRGRALRHGRTLRRPRALREGQPAALREQLRRRAWSRWSSAPRTSRPART